MSNKTRDTGNLTSNGILSVDLVNGRIGIGSTQPQQTVDVDGTIRATAFVNSDGSAVGVGYTANVETNTLRVTGVSTFQNNIDVTGHTEIDNLNVSGVSTFQSHVYLGDNDSLYLGADQDLSIYHDGTSGISWIQETGAGDLRLATNSSVVIQNTTGTAKTSAEFSPDGAAELYYNNSKKFETTNTGAIVTGILTATSFSGAGVTVSGTAFSNQASVSGVCTATAFVGDGSELKSVSGTTLATYASASDIAYSAKSIVGFSTYNQVGILTAGPTNLGAGDNFGRAVAMSANGKTLFVGAPDDEINGAVNSSGAVYVFERVGAGSSFNQLGILTGSSENGQFGESIACSADGKTVVVNAVWDANDLGLAYVFDRSGDTYTRVGILSNSIPDPNNYSGPYTSADISADGKLIILANEGVQPPGMLDDTGAVFVWKRDGNTFNEVGIITNRRNTANSEYSESIAISGDGKTIVVGALSDFTGGDTHGSVSIFDVVGVGTNLSFNNVGILTGFLYSGDAGDSFGCSVDINYDGSSIIVGDFTGEIEGGTVTTGTAHVYDRVGDTYSLVQTFTGSQSVTNGAFGNTVVMSPDGKQILVTAQGEPTDPVYKFERYGNTITQVGIITAYSPDYTFNMGTPFDKHLAMSADAKSILIGYEDTSVGGTAGGAAVVYDQVNQTSLMSDSSGNLLIRDNTITRFTFDRTTGDFTATGNVTAYSDITFKKNIELIPNALDKVLNLRGVTYNRTDIENEPKQSGVVAQEVEKVLPEVVNTNDEGIKSVAYGNMVGLLIEAIKEQQTTIENLTKRIEILEGGN